MKALYHILEWLGGERTKGIGLVPYKIAQRLKWSLLIRMKGE